MRESAEVLLLKSCRMISDANSSRTRSFELISFLTTFLQKKSFLHGRNLSLELSFGLLQIAVRKHDVTPIVGLFTDVVLEAIPSDAPGESDVLVVEGLALGMQTAQVGVFEQTDDIGL